MMEPLTLQEIVVKSIVDDLSFFHKYVWLLPVRQRKNIHKYALNSGLFISQYRLQQMFDDCK